VVAGRTIFNMACGRNSFASWRKMMNHCNVGQSFYGRPESISSLDVGCVNSDFSEIASDSIIRE
jgi:hypothetical protein